MLSSWSHRGDEESAEGEDTDGRTQGAAVSAAASLLIHRERLGSQSSPRLQHSKTGQHRKQPRRGLGNRQFEEDALPRCAAKKRISVQVSVKERQTVLRPLTVVGCSGKAIQRTN